MSDEANSAETEAATTEAVADAETTLVTGTEAEVTTEGTAADDTAETQATDPNEGKTPEEIEAEAKAKAEADKAAEGAPEEYAEFTMPEGIELDTEMAAEFKGAAKDLNLTQEAAQRMVDLAAKMRQRDVEAIVNLRAEWVDQTKSDKEIGGDKLDATLGVARKAVDAYGSPAFKELLNQSGLGNHPEVVRFMANVGKTVSEDKVVKGNGQPTTPQGTLAARIFSKE